MSGREGPPSRPLSRPLLGVARVVGAHGVGGALRVRLHDADSTALQVGIEVSLRDDDGNELRRGVVRRVAPKPGSALVRVWIEGVEDKTSADALRDLELAVPRASLPALADDEYYLADAIGQAVLEGERALGTIVGVTSNGAQDLFEVEWTARGGKTRRWLLPVLPQFVTAIDEDGVHVDLPPGLLPTELEREDRR